jgi:ELWxxDGT repeat protein
MAWRGRLYFLGYGRDQSGGSRLGLWSTDGTTEDPLFLSEVNGERVVPIPSQILFTAGPSSEDLWGTDGTLEGTRLLHDFPEFNSLFAFLVAVGDVAYFFGSNNGELWTSDGTPEGTHPVPGFPAGVFPDLTTLQRLGGRWLFLSYARIWTAGDGFSGAAPLTGCEGGACPGVLQILPDTDPGRRLFIGKDPAHGIELWITDGTGAGTRRLADVCPGACDGLHFDRFTPVVLGSSRGKSWFLAYPDDESKGELWVTDGTAAGTRRIAAYIAPAYTAPVGFLDGRAYFGLWGTDAYSSELWTADGSRSGTRRVAPLKRIAPGSYPLFVPLDDGSVLFGATKNAIEGETEGVVQGVRRRLWKSDGTAEGTALLAGFRGYLLDDFSFNGFTRVGSSYFFLVYREDSDGASLGDELWRTDGTRSGTRKLMSFDQFAETDVARAWNGKYLFTVDGSDLDTWSYWVSDGTPAGTREIVPPLPGVRFPTGLHPFGSRFLFVARTQRADGFVPQLFVSDGTPAGTRPLTDLRGTREPLETEFVQMGGTAFFRVRDRAGEPVAWRTDGTPKGTRRAFDLKAVAHLQVFQGSLYLTAALDDDGARGLFRVDDPQGPPVLVAPVSPPYEAGFSGKPAFTPLGGRLFFPGSDSGSGGAGGRELWVTDGTAAGTKRVLDVRPGPDSSDPGGLTVAGDRVFFAADDGVHGRELWVSDGTAAGTRLVWDLNPGEASSNPQSLTVSGDNLFFGADDGETGPEPWVLRLER